MSIHGKKPAFGKLKTGHAAYTAASAGAASSPGAAPAQPYGATRGGPDMPSNTDQPAGKPVRGRRLLAFIIDSLLFLVPLWFIFGTAAMRKIDAAFAANPGLAGTPEGELMMWEALLPALAIYCIGRILYAIILEAGPWQATLGKKLMGIIVTDSTGRKPALWSVIMRNTLGRLVVNLVPLNIGYWMVVFTEDRKGLHDYMSSTLVCKRLSVSDPTPHAAAQVFA